MSLARAELARLSELLGEALSLPRANRAAWLQRLSETDAALRPPLEAILAQAAHETTGGGHTQATLAGLLDAMPDLASAAAAAKFTEPEVSEMGPYRLLRRLGHGGMGTVWLAERIDGSLQREVALKLPHASTQHLPNLARRFERERNILAALEHPHIARLYDAGATESGQPYLALEYVEGLPITQYCDEKKLPLRARVDLFLQVLEAIQYAHAHLVVHRDLKPSNIFVTDTVVAHGLARGDGSPSIGPDRRAAARAGVHGGQVRLLDFGIATLLADHDADGDGPAAQAHTEWAHAPMTPHYASPEQIAREPIGTASDVYSLGVVLYELLTGQRPYRLPRDTRGALEEAILHVNPTKPSRLPTTESTAELRAQRPEGLRRQLRGDLDNITLMALRKSPAERYASAEAFQQDLRRWLHDRPVRAHPRSWWYLTRKFVQRNKLPVLASTVAIAGTLGGLAVALDQAAVARRESQRAHAVQDFLVGLFNEADPGLAQGREMTVRDLMTKGERDLQGKLAGQPELNVELSGVLVEMYKKLGDGKRALPLAEARRDLTLKTYGEDSLEHARALISLAEVQSHLSQHDQSLATLAQARALAERQRRRDPKLLVDVMVIEGWGLNMLTRFEDSLANFVAALPQTIRLYGPDSYEVASVRGMIVANLSSLGRVTEADQVLAVLEPALDRGWPGRDMDRASLRSAVGYAQWRMRRLPEAAKSLEGSLKEQDRLAGPLNSKSIRTMNTLGRVYLDSGRFAEADRVFAGNVDRARRYFGEADGQSALHQSMRVMSLLHLGSIEEASTTARETVALTQTPQSTLGASATHNVHRRVSAALLLAGQTTEALGKLDELLAAETATRQADVGHATTLMYRATALSALGRHAEATATAENAIEAWRNASAKAGVAGPLGEAYGQLNTALAWLAAGQPMRAEHFIDEAEATLRTVHTQPHPDLPLAALVRSQWLRASGKVAEADALQRESRERYKALSGVEAPQVVRLVF